jgi:hypothetical protein
MANQVNKALGFVWGGIKKVAKEAEIATKEMEELGVAEEKVNKPSAFQNYIKNLKEASKEFGGFADSLFGAGGDRPSIVDVARKKIVSLNEALKDTVSKASDIQKEFSIGIPLIEQSVQSLTDQIAEAQKLVNKTSESKKLLKDLVKQRSELVAELSKLKTAEKVTVTPESFLEGIGLKSDKRFLANATQTIEKMERLVKSINNLTLTNPTQIAEANKRLFSEIKANFEFLPKELQARAKAINKVLSESIPVDNIRKGLNQWVDDFNSTTGRMVALGQQLAQGLSQGFEDFFFNSITGKITSLEDAFRSMTTSMLRSLSKFLGQKATQEFLGLAFGATGQQTTSNLGAAGGIAGMLRGKISGGISKAGGFVKGLFGGGNAARSAIPSGFPSNPSFGATALGGIGGILSSSGSGISKLLGFADGGIANFSGFGEGIHANPTLAAIAEKPGKKEAVVPLEKFADLVQQPNITINAMDTKSFSQFLGDNKEIVLGTINSVKGSALQSRVNAFQSGPF